MFIINYMNLLLNSVFYKKKSLFYTFLVQIWILLYFNSTLADRTQYQVLYENPGQNAYIGGRLISTVGNFLGVPFYIYLGLYLAVILLLIATTIQKFSEKPGIVLSLFFLFPLVIDGIQLRNFLVLAIIAKAIPFLVDKNKNGLIKYVVIVLVAASFHYSALFYLSFILVRYFDEKKLLIIIAVLTTILVVTKELLPMIAMKILPFAATKISALYTVKGGIQVSYEMLIFFILNIIMSWLAYNKKKQLSEGSTKIKIKETRSLEVSNSKMSLEFAEVVFKINIVLLLVFPALLIAGEFFRWFRVIILFSYILYSNVYNVRKNHLVIDVLYIIIFFIVFIWSVYQFEFGPYYSIVVTPLFENNNFIQWILELPKVN